MKIISHKGLECQDIKANTARAIHAATQLSIDGIEFDVRITKDKHFVLNHGKYLPFNRKISAQTLTEIKQTFDGRVSSLKEALESCGNSVAIIEIKDRGASKHLLQNIDDVNKFGITTFHSGDVQYLSRKLSKTTPLYFAGRQPFCMVKRAVQYGANGVTVHILWLLIAPWIYYSGRKKNLRIMVFTIDRVFLAKLIVRYMPNIEICTNRPDVLSRKLRDQSGQAIY